MDSRAVKDLLYEQVAHIGRALASPKRLELIELLCQGDKTVEALAQELQIDIKLASAHLKALRQARLVDVRPDGKYRVYALAGNDVSHLWVMLREVAQAHLQELQNTVSHMVAQPDKLSPVDGEALLRMARDGDVVVIDVRPTTEFDSAHVPFARSLPMEFLEQRLQDLPKNKMVVAYCRGPFCLLSDQAVNILRGAGLQAYKMLDGVSEWQAMGLPVVVADHPSAAA
jgi:rhodanese-related sulfurtransferase/DNA-binding transcriptional ArsR family regulator